MGQAEGIGQVLAALAFQDPQQQGGQIRAHALGRTGLAQPFPQLAAQLAAGDLAAQQGLVASEQLVADRLEEVEMAQQVGNAPQTAVGDRFGTRPAQIAQHGQRVAEGSQGALDGRAQLLFVLRSDTHCVEDPAGPAGQAQERPALALVARGVDVQGIALGHGGAQGRSPLPVQPLQHFQEAIAEGGDGTGREGEALAQQGLADLLALEVAVIAGQPDPHDQVVAVALAGRGQIGQRPGDGDGVGLASEAVLADLAGPPCAGGQGEQQAGLGLLRAEGLAAVRAVPLLGDEIDARRGSRNERGAGDPVSGPTRLAGLFEPQRQQRVEPPFGPIPARSKRWKTA